MSDNYNTAGFQQNLKFNEEHLIIAQRFFEERGYRCTKADTAGAKHGGISMNVTDPSYPRDYITVSVKADSWIGKTGNLLIEVGHVRKELTGQSRRETGWLTTLKAQKLVIVDTTQQYVYLFDWTTLKKFVNDNIDNPDICTKKEQENRFDTLTVTTNLLININILESNGLIEARRKYEIQFY